MHGMPGTSRDGSGTGRLGAALGAAALIWLAASAGHTPGVPAEDEPGPRDFSAARARERLARILGDGAPHPLGSPAHDAVRTRLEAEIRAAGLVPVRQEADACGTHGTCGRIGNLLARIPGDYDRQAILLVAHPDSARVAPGASDDGIGVAALLEVGAILAAEAPLEAPVLLLFADGEEAGLLGAEAFAASHPWFREVGTVVNVDGRGTDGPGILFETGPGSVAAVAALARYHRNPVGSSAFDALYRRMPTDTDFTVFRDRGLPGLNFAYVGDISRYHTPLDTLANLSPATLQHQGENLLAACRGLLAARDPPRPGDEAVYADLLGRVLVWCRVSTMRVLAGLGLALWLWIAWRRTRRTEGEEESGDPAAPTAAPGCRTAALLVVPATLVSGTAAGCLAILVLGWLGAVPWWWVADPTPALVAVRAAVLAGCCFGAAGRLGRAGPGAVTSAVWSAWLGIGLVTAALLPGASYLFVLPALDALATVALGRRGTRDPGLAPVLLAFLLWIPLVRLQYPALGFAWMVPGPLLCAWVATPLLPLVGSLGRARALGGLALAVSLVAGVLSLTSPAFTRDRPQRLSIVHHQDADGSARWLVEGFFGPLPEGVRQALGGDPGWVRPFAWSSRMQAAWSSPAPARSSPGPVCEVVGSVATPGGRRVRARLESRRGATVAGLLLPPGSGLVSARMGGVSAPDRPTRSYDWGNGWKALSAMTLPPEGVEIELELSGRDPVEIWVFDRSGTDLPPEMDRLLEARPPEAVPSHLGDLSVRTLRVRL